MTLKKELLDELKIQFEKSQKEIGFETSFEELNNLFFIEDAILSAGFVSNSFSRQLCSRITDGFGNWENYLHSLLMPNPGSMMNQTEAKLFQNPSDREEIWNMISKLVGFITLNNLVGITKDLQKEKEFIDGVYNFWINEFKPFSEKLLTRIKKAWNREQD
jgi:hypothetical protein